MLEIETCMKPDFELKIESKPNRISNNYNEKVVGFVRKNYKLKTKKNSSC